jgi:hypothetical protein
MNDPHGMFQMKGTTHVFFQYNPKNIKWGEPLASSAACVTTATRAHACTAGLSTSTLHPTRPDSCSQTCAAIDSQTAAAA